jgi:hypothetical protein
MSPGEALIMGGRKENGTVRSVVGGAEGTKTGCLYSWELFAG